MNQKGNAGLGYLLAHFVTKFMEGRYVLPAIIGVTAILAILGAPFYIRKQSVALFLSCYLLLLL
jgi:hypothetical protein